MSSPAEQSLNVMSDGIDHQKHVEFYSAGLTAWYTTRLEHDKGLLTLSAGGIGLLMTLMTTVGVSSAESLVLHVSALVTFLVCLIARKIVVRPRFPAQSRFAEAGVILTRRGFFKFGTDDREIYMDRGIKDEAFVRRALKEADFDMGRWIANQSFFNDLDASPIEKSGSDHDFLPGLGSLRLEQVV